MEKSSCEMKKFLVLWPDPSFLKKRAHDFRALALMSLCCTFVFKCQEKYRVSHRLAASLVCSLFHLVSAQTEWIEWPE